jgi:catechol 2,3-dioxygenase-like lactoylglutathione lyase family enzyme
VTIQFETTAPVLRIFSVEKAREFYLDFLGFTVAFEHRFEPDLPLYMGISRGGLTLHLSEHHGDATPGSAVFVWMTGIDELHAELAAKRYGYNRPGIQEQPWGRGLTVTDPFANRIHFYERPREEAPVP